MLGKIFKKNAVLPGGPGAAAAMALPPPIIGKKFPTYRWTDLLVSYPGISGMLLFLPLLMLSATYILVAVPFAFDIKDYRISGHEAEKAFSLGQTAMAAWRAAQYRASEGVSVSYCFAQLLQLGTLPSNSEEWASVDRTEPKNRFNILYSPKDSARLPPGSFPDHSAHSVWNLSSYKKDQGYKGWELIGAQPTLLHPEALAEIRMVEEKLLGYLERHEILACWTSSQFQGKQLYNVPKCAPFTSAIPYFYPGDKKDVLVTAATPNCNSTTPMWSLDGTGTYLQDPKQALGLLLKTNPNWRWFVGEQAYPSMLHLPVLRTQVTFSSPISPEDGDNTYSTWRQENQVLQTLLNDVEIFLEVITSDLKYVTVTWGGGALQDREVLRALRRDQRLTSLSALLQLVLISYHTHSIFIGLMMAILLWSPIPASRLLYILAFQANTQGLLMTISVQFTMSFSLCCIYVICTSFFMSGQMASHGRFNRLSLRQRVAWLYRKGGVAVAISSLIVIACFISGLFIPIPALREFCGLMVFQLVLYAYLLLTVFPCIIIFHHLHFSGKRRNAQRRREIFRKSKATLLKRHPHVASFMLELFGHSPLQQRPHILWKTGQHIVGSVATEDFRKNRRKQNADDVCQVPLGLVFPDDETVDVVRAEVCNIIASKSGVRESRRPEWSAMEWQGRQQILEQGAH
mmetsp:Transcript_21531/g.38661  ORF Transcript_21531/g.38661 Transcript_21531/m.38661 type:complete len:686 (-) Transcript_21531:23-2080(-)